MDDQTKTCDSCGSADQVVTVGVVDEPKFNACRRCYAKWKRRHVYEGVRVCSNCFEELSGDRCIRCGNEVGPSGDVIRV